MRPEEEYELRMVLDRLKATLEEMDLQIAYQRGTIQRLEAILPGTSGTSTTTSAQSVSVQYVVPSSLPARKSPESRSRSTEAEDHEEGELDPASLVRLAPAKRVSVLDWDHNPGADRGLGPDRTALEDPRVGPRRNRARDGVPRGPVGTQPVLDRQKGRKKKAPEDLPDSPCHPNRTEDWEE